MRAITLILLLLSSSFVSAAGTGAVLYAEDFENGKGLWTAPSFVGTTEGCLGAASGARSLQIADCGSYLPFFASSSVIGATVPIPYRNASIEIELAVRGMPELYVGGAHFVLSARCSSSTEATIGAWTVGIHPLALVHAGYPNETRAPPEWTAHRATLTECRGNTLILRLAYGVEAGSAPAAQLFAMDAIEVRSP